MNARILHEGTPAPGPTAGGDSDELEALFDRVAAERALACPAIAAPAHTPTEAVRVTTDPTEQLFQRVGRLTRTLHDALRELGYDKKIASAANSLPDARDRLLYVATLSGQSAERVLGAVEAAQDVQGRLDGEARALHARWSRLYANELSVDEFKVLAGTTRDFLATVAERSGVMQQLLHEIMMAQDFHDLTGQVVKKVVDLAATLESNLIGLLVETQQLERTDEERWLSGPAIHADRGDVVANQAQVDVLLESLGF